ncbi:MAG TPA: type II toxin-antitoxin system HipA family toxin [Verrucomicrobiales bacterium]|nr:type II toxin-antitoxin system HipA family toxin [Verrucomicrobiales bacterium]
MTTEVHIDWQGVTSLVGRLHTPERGLSASFEYATDWLSRADAFALDPTSLPLQRPAHHASVLHSVFQDAGPDRWGRLLIERAVRKKVLSQKPWRDLDYVLALDDVSRIGALRFREAGGDVFLSPGTGKLPPIVRIGTLIQAADAIHHETETVADLRFLLAEGSPLGGARPKSAVLLKNGQLGIAKFPKPDDRRDIAAGEILALTLARQAGMTVADHQFLTAAGRSVSVITRFDRSGQQRLPFISAATLLGLSHDQSTAYTMIADAIRQHGDDVTRDLHEAWRRMVFGLLASNCDDHARNHGFLMLAPGRWSLSPAYDLNPVPEIERALLNKTAISEDHEEPSIELALRVAARFALKPAQAKGILREVLKTVQSWRETGKELRIQAKTLAAYESAFEHTLADEARALAK